MIKTVICIMMFALAIEGAPSADPSPTPRPDKSQYTLFNPTPVDLRRPYNTDRPSKTDSPFTIDAGVFQIESDVWNWQLDEPDTKHGDERIRLSLIHISEPTRL